MDHVIPRRLGGTDDPFNLVTACTSCNLGKSATSLLDPTIPDVTQEVALIAEAFRVVGEQHESRNVFNREFSDYFMGELTGWVKANDDMPDDFQVFLEEMERYGIGMEFIIDRIPSVARSKTPWQSLVTLLGLELMGRMGVAVDVVKRAREVADEEKQSVFKLKDEVRSHIEKGRPCPRYLSNS